MRTPIALASALLLGLFLPVRARGGYALHLVVGSIAEPECVWDAPSCNVQVAPGTDVTVSIVAECPPDSTLAGANYALGVPGGLTHFGFYAAPGFITVNEYPWFSVAYTGGCLQGCVVLARHDFHVTSSEIGALLRLEAAYGYEQTLVVDCAIQTHVPSCLAGAAINHTGPAIDCGCENPTAAEGSSWGAIKGLWR